MAGDRWEFWRDALRFRELTEKQREQHLQAARGEEAPFPGFWRASIARGVIMPPIAIWDAEAVTVAMMGRRERAGDPWQLLPFDLVMRPWDEWHCWQHAVSEERFREAVASGRWWDDRPASRQSANPGAPVRDVLEAAPIVPRRPR